MGGFLFRPPSARNLVEALFRMPCALISSSSPFDEQAMPFATSILDAVSAHRATFFLPSSSPLTGIAVVVCDALRDYDLPKFQEKVLWAAAQVTRLGFDRYDVLPVVVYWPVRGVLPIIRGRRVRRLTPAIIHGASVIVLCGGNAIALLQSFKQNQAMHETIQSEVMANRLMVLTWSAGSTCSGESAEHTRDRRCSLHLTTGAPLCRLGIKLIQGFSFAPHLDKAQHQDWVAKWRARTLLHWQGITVVLPDRTFVVFHNSSQPVYWNSTDIGWFVLNK
jgi:hypothetical protein